MNSKMTILLLNSQLSTTEPPPPKTKQKQKQTKQTNRTGTESQKWRSHGGSSVGRGKRRGVIGEKVQGIRRLNGRSTK